MSEIVIETTRVKKEVNELNNLENSLRQMYERLENVKKSLVFNSSAFNGIKENIETIILDVEKEKEFLGDFKTVLNNIVEQYEKTEKKVVQENGLKSIYIKAKDSTSESEEANNRDEQIEEYAKQWDIEIGDCKWTTMDIFIWKTYGGDEYLFQQKEKFIEKYSDVINDAAEKYNIPAFLLAGIVYSEYGGDPMWIDNVAYNVRDFDWCGPDWVDENLTITKNPYLTSFGNVSIQVRRAAETLGYDINDMSNSEIKSMIDKLENPVTNIYIAAAHVSDLRDIDYRGIDAADLSKEEIIVIATRYNRGPDLSLDEINNDTSYGNAIYRHKDSISSALGD